MEPNRTPLRLSTFRLFVSVVTLTFILGCAVGSQTLQALHHSSRGAVYLEELPRTVALATHPTSIDQATITRILRGLQVQDQPHGLLPREEAAPKPAPAFTPEAIEFLAPQLVSALNKAEPRQQLIFRSIEVTEDGPLATGGTLYVTWPVMHITLTHFRYPATSPAILYATEGQLPYSTALTRRTVRFLPESAVVPARDDEPALDQHPTLTTLAVDMEALPALIEEAPPQDQESQSKEQGTPRGVQTQQATTTHSRSAEGAALHEAEVRGLRDEIQVLKNQLADREQVIQQLTKKREPPVKQQNKTEAGAK